MRSGTWTLIFAAVAWGCSNGDEQPITDTPSDCAPPRRSVGETCVDPGVSDDGCPAGTLIDEEGNCRPAGMTPDDCGEGFEHDGDIRCEPILPAEPCPSGQLAVPGSSPSTQICAALDVSLERRLTMRHSDTIAAITLAAGIVTAACSDDTNTTSSSSSTAATTSQSNTTSSTTGSSNGGSSQGGSTGGTSQGGTGGMGQGGSGGGILGCAENPNICPQNWECCEGVPYPAQGICLPQCTMDSDRSAKHDIAPVDSDAVLERLAALPVARWRYDASPESEHMGPMAQDFHAAFGLGDSERRIATVDANGVMMAALQALYRRQAASERENAALRAEIAALRAELERR